MFHYQARENFNQRALEIVSLIKEKQEEIQAQKEPIGSFAHKDIEDYTDKIDTSKDIISSDFDRVNKEKLSFETTKNGVTKSLSGEDFNKLKLLVESIHKLESINSVVEKEFILNISFKWILDISDNGYSNEYCSFLESNIKEEIDDFVVKYEILYLDIHRPFLIGDVSIEYLTEDFFQPLSNKKGKVEDVESFKKRFLGKVHVSATIKGCSLETARKIAYEKCCFAVDIIKFHSETVYHPQIRLDFDLDTRVNFHINSMSISHKVNDRSSLLLEASSGGIEHYTLNNKMIDFIEKKNWFLKILDNKENNEVKLLLKKSISSYAHALSNKNIHKRIVELCSIWESLLLKSSTSNIKESLMNYGSKILEPDINRRNTLKNVISNFYDIRSKYIHHVKESDIDFDGLAEFQRRTILLFEIYEKVSDIYNTKIKFLEDIDSYIDKSFNPITYLNSKGLKV